MRILSIIVMAALVGVTVGGAMAYVEFRLDHDFVPKSASAEAEPAGPAPVGVPRAEVPETHFNFGTMQRGTMKSHQFVIKNVGDAPLRLEIGPTSCKCTLSNVTDKPLLPGESTHVRLEWQAKIDGGEFRQNAIIRTPNDPSQQEIEFSIEGTVTDAKGVSPPDLMFGKIQHGQSKTAQVYVMAMLQDDLNVTDPQLSHPDLRDHFDIKIEEVKKEELPDKNARNGVRITVTAKDDLPVGRINQWLSVKTNLPDFEKLEIPLYGQVVGDIRADGVGWNEETGVLMLGRVKSSEGAKSRLNLFVRGENAADVKFSVKSVDPAELKVTIGDLKKLSDTMAHVPIEIEVPAGTRPMVRLDTAQGEEGSIVLSTTHPTNKEVVFAVRFSVEK